MRIPSFPDRPVSCIAEPLEERLCLSHSGSDVLSGTDLGISSIVSKRHHHHRRSHGHILPIGTVTNRTTDSLGQLLTVGTVPGTPAAGTTFALGSTNPFAGSFPASGTIGVVNFQPVGTPTFATANNFGAGSGLMFGPSFLVSGSFGNGVIFASTG